MAIFGKGAPAAKMFDKAKKTEKVDRRKDYDFLNPDPPLLQRRGSVSYKDDAQFVDYFQNTHRSIPTHQLRRRVFILPSDLKNQRETEEIRANLHKNKSVRKRDKSATPYMDLDEAKNKIDKAKQGGSRSFSASYSTSQQYTSSH